MSSVLEKVEKKKDTKVKVTKKEMKVTKKKATKKKVDHVDKKKAAKAKMHKPMPARGVVDDGPVDIHDIIDARYIKAATGTRSPQVQSMAATSDDQPRWWRIKDDNIYVHNGSGQPVIVYHSPADARVIKEIEVNGGGGFNAAGVTLNAGFNAVMETMHNGNRAFNMVKASRPNEYAAIPIGGYTEWALVSIQVMREKQGVAEWHCFQQPFKKGKKITVNDLIVKGPPFYSVNSPDPMGLPAP